MTMMMLSLLSPLLQGRFYLVHTPDRYCTVLYCTVLYCTVLYCTVLYCNVLYCTVLHDAGPSCRGWRCCTGRATAGRGWPPCPGTAPTPRACSPTSPTTAATAATAAAATRRRRPLTRRPSTRRRRATAQPRARGSRGCCGSHSAGRCGAWRGRGRGRGPGTKAAAPPDYAHVIIESRPAGAAQLAAEEVYLEPRDSIIFEMRPTAADIFHADTVLAASHYSLDLSLPTLQRRSVRRNSSHRQQQQQQQQPPGRVEDVRSWRRRRCTSSSATPSSSRCGRQLRTS